MDFGIFFEGDVKNQSTLFNLVLSFLILFERLIKGDCLGEEFFLGERGSEKLLPPIVSKAFSSSSIISVTESTNTSSLWRKSG